MTKIVAKLQVESVSLLVGERRRIGNRVGDQWVVLNVCDNGVEGSDHPGKEQKLWLMSSRRC